MQSSSCIDFESIPSCSYIYSILIQSSSCIDIEESILSCFCMYSTLIQCSSLLHRHWRVDTLIAFVEIQHDRNKLCWLEFKSHEVDSVCAISVSGYELSIQDALEPSPTKLFQCSSQSWEMELAKSKWCCGYDRGEPAVSYRWSGWVWEITGWSWRLQENYRSF